MKQLLLVDSSVWVEVTRGKSPPAKVLQNQVSSLLAEGIAAMTAPVWLELYQGIKGKREEADLATLRDLCVWLDFDHACWEQAAKEARLCLRKGINVPKSDLLVHACASRHQAKILHRDHHFDLIEKACI